MTTVSGYKVSPPPAVLHWLAMGTEVGGHSLPSSYHQIIGTGARADDNMLLSGSC